MSRALVRLALLLLVAGYSPAATASVYSDDLGKCLVSHTSSDDKLVFMQWMFAALALHPAVQQYASITAEQRKAITEKMATLFSRLLTDLCRQEGVNALKYDGQGALRVGFQLFGQVAAHELYANSQVLQGLSGAGDMMKETDAIKSLFKEAGIPLKDDK
jgi:hypothetical protein